MQYLILPVKPVFHARKSRGDLNVRLCRFGSATIHNFIIEAPISVYKKK